MKTLKFICVLLTLFCSSQVWAKKEIPLFPGNDANAEAAEDRRTLVWEPTAAIDSENIILYSDVTMEMTVSIYDASNHLVQTLSLTCADEASFDLLQTLPRSVGFEIQQF